MSWPSLVLAFALVPAKTFHFYIEIECIYSNYHIPWYYMYVDEFFFRRTTACL